MSIRAQRFATKARTWLLIAGLTALLIGIGALIGGTFILVSSIAAMVAGTIAAIANVLQFSLLFGGDEEDAGPLGWIGLIGTIVLAPLAASLLQLGVSRQREYLADATGAGLLGRASPLADALETLERRAQTIQLGDCVALHRQPAAEAGPRDAFLDPPSGRRAGTKAPRARWRSDASSRRGASRRSVGTDPRR